MITPAARLVIVFVFVIGLVCELVGAVLAVRGDAAYKDFLQSGTFPIITGLLSLLARTRPDPGEKKPSAPDQAAGSTTDTP